MKKVVRGRPKKMSVASKATYNRDFYRWTKSQVSLLRKKEFTHLDVENLIEEIESLGKKRQESSAQSTRQIIKT
jgi:hypothetical protein